MSIIISMPLYITKGFVCKKRRRVLDKNGKPKPRKYHINLNNYRNWHSQLSNSLKIMYKEIAVKKFDKLGLWQIETPIKLTFTMYRGDKRRVDRANVLSIHEKFFCDALVEESLLTDDNDEYITSSHYYTGEIDRDNPRVDIEIGDI